MGAQRRALTMAAGQKSRGAGAIRPPFCMDGAESDLGAEAGADLGQGLGQLAEKHGRQQPFTPPRGCRWRSCITADCTSNRLGSARQGARRARGEASVSAAARTSRPPGVVLLSSIAFRAEASSARRRLSTRALTLNGEGIGAGCQDLGPDTAVGGPAGTLTKK